MSDFRTYHLAKRVPAVPMQPVIDPAGWEPQSLGPVQDWAYRISDGIRRSCSPRSLISASGGCRCLRSAKRTSR